ncbi:MAG: hypothetical protein ACYDGM_13665 [Vulcanimicrobiaceae bacterium]
MKHVRPAAIVGAVAFAITLIVAHGRSTPYNNYVLLAQALLHGHVWIDWPGAYIDALAYNGAHYVIEAPMPALLLMPFVAVFGLSTNQTLLAVVLAGVAIGATYELGERFNVPRARNLWICAFLLAGTDLLWCAMLGDVWFIAHVSAVCFTMLALCELAGRKRGWLVALWAVCALASRFTFVLALPVYGYLLATDGEGLFVLSERARLAVLTFCIALVPCAVLFVWYNLARWGTWSDIGYTAWYHQDQAGMPTGSPFRLLYLPYQLVSFFVQAPTILPEFPWLRPELGGVALTWTSPALILAFFARKPLRWVAALWVLVVLCAAPNFVYYVNGFAQFGMRHALDFEPFLVALMLLFAREQIPKWGYALIAYSCAVGLWGCWYWNVFIRPAN